LELENETRSETIIINEAQLLLAEKRTALATLRTGISVFVLPLSVLSVLIATSRYYDIWRVMYFVVPLLVLCAGLVVLGVYLTHRSILKLRRYERALRELKKEHEALARIID
jgi:uncharacterized membrane protein YidH (DUF202 family)